MMCYAPIAYQLLYFAIADNFSGVNNAGDHLRSPNLSQKQAALMGLSVRYND
jgi:hypothetical protein